MKKLSKTESAKRDELVEELRTNAGKVEDAINVFNEKMKAEFQSVVSAIEAYNEAVKRADEFREDIENQQSEYIGERSEKWADSDAGQAYESWHGEWETALDEAECDEPTDIEAPSFEAADVLENLPESPE